MSAGFNTANNHCHFDTVGERLCLIHANDLRFTKNIHFSKDRILEKKWFAFHWGIKIYNPVVIIH